LVDILQFLHLIGYRKNPRRFTCPRGFQNISKPQAGQIPVSIFMVKIGASEYGLWVDGRIFRISK
jgi:hypothetical protein